MGEGTQAADQKLRWGTYVPAGYTVCERAWQPYSSSAISCFQPGLQDQPYDQTTGHKCAHSVVGGSAITMCGRPFSSSLRRGRPPETLEPIMEVGQNKST